MVAVGKIYQIQVEADTPHYGVNVLAVLNSYAKACPKVRAFLQNAKAVTLSITRRHRGSGAACYHSSSRIKVSTRLSDTDEMAESVLFELCNWEQGDFGGSAKERMLSGELTPLRAGMEVAEAEARSSLKHRDLMQALKDKGFELSTFGERNRTKIGGLSPEQVQSKTKLTPHDRKAKATDKESLFTPYFYFYEFIESAANAELTLRAVQSPLPWMKPFVEGVFEKNGEAGQYGRNESNATLYVKLLDLAKKYGRDILGGYEFSSAMKLIAGETRLANMGLRGMLRAFLKEIQKPDDLEDKLKEVGLLK
jgi:hypothetical protein